MPACYCKSRIETLLYCADLKFSPVLIVGLKYYVIFGVLLVFYCASRFFSRYIGFLLTVGDFRPFSTSPVSYRNVPVSMRSLKMGFQIYVFPVDSRSKIKSSSQVNFLTCYGSINQSTFTKF